MTPLQARRGVDVVTVLMVMSVAAALAGLTWRLTGQDDGQSRVFISTRAPASTAAGDVAATIALAPFGGAAVADVAAPTAATGLVLRGIVQGYPPGLSRALIAGASGTAARSYAVGEAIEGSSTTLESIGRDQVILRVGDHQEALGFPQPVSATAPAPARATALRAARAIPSPAAPVPTGPAAGATAPTGAASLPSIVEDYRRRVTANPSAVAQGLGAQATAGGYQIGPNPSPELLRAGLLPGDVVATVNGVTLGEAESDRRVFDQALVSGRARVEVVRDGRRIALSFPLR